MTAEVEEVYHFKDEPPRYHIIPDAVRFNKKNGQYPAKVILNPKYKDIESKFFILFQTNPIATIKPLGNNDAESSIAQGYYVDVEYDEKIDEETLICRGFAAL